MNKVKILLVENTPSMAATLGHRLDLDMRFAVSQRSDATAAVELIEKEEFDVVLIDLHLAERASGEPIFDGIAVGEAVRRCQKHAVIVMYSQQIAAGKEAKFPHYDECVRAGADRIVARAPLFSLTQANLSALIDQLIDEKRKAESATSNVEFDGGLGTAAAIEVFGATQLRRLLAKCVLTHTHLKVQAIQSGYSGAALFRVTAAIDAKFSNPLHLVVKVSRSQFALDEELKRKPEAGSHFGSSSVVPHTHVVTVHDDLSAVSIAEVRKKRVLREYLLEEKLTRSSGKLLSRVVSDLLVAPASESRPSNELDMPPDAYALRASALWTIDEFLSEANTWDSILKSSQKTALKATQKLLGKVADGHWNFATAGRHAAQLHGDFHCRNVFVSTDDAPIVIDFGRSGVYPRLFDFAALDADLVVSLLDHSFGNDQNFGKIDEWYRSVTRAFPFASPGALVVDGRIGYLRGALLNGLDQLSKISRAEYAETLMFQYLRYIRFPTVSFPKRILAARLIAKLSRVLNLS